MRVFKRNSAQGGFNVMKKAGAIMPLMRMPTEGLGKANTEEFFEKVGSKNILETLAPHKMKSLEAVKLKSSRPKKFISLNV
jgi:hypothetical protein